MESLNDLIKALKVSSYDMTYNGERYIVKKYQDANGVFSKHLMSTTRDRVIMVEYQSRLLSHNIFREIDTISKVLIWEDYYSDNAEVVFDSKAV